MGCGAAPCSGHLTDRARDVGASESFFLPCYETIEKYNHLPKTYRLQKSSFAERSSQLSLTVVEQTVGSGYTQNRFKLQSHLPKFRRNLERTVPREVNQTKLVCLPDARLSTPNSISFPSLHYCVLCRLCPRIGMHYLRITGEGRRSKLIRGQISAT